MKRRPPSDGRRRSIILPAAAKHLIGPAAENLLRPARGGSSRSTCAFPPPYRRHRTRIRWWPESGTSRASAVAALPDGRGPLAERHVPALVLLAILDVRRHDACVVPPRW